MNDESPHDMTEQRLARDLRSAARGMPLAPGSEVAVVATGKRRRHRRRQANAIMLVAATGFGTALTIRQLARNGESSFATDTLPTTESTGSVPQQPAPGTTMPVEASFPVTIPASVPLATAPPSSSDEPAPAEIVESNMVWNVIEPDSTQAVAYGDMRSPATSGAQLPGVILATAPGRSDDYVPQMWRSDDGVTWTALNIDPPFGGLESLRFAGDRVYAVGTAPGIASTESNPLMLGESQDGGTTWDQIELPVDTNAGHDLPFVMSVSSMAMLYPLDEGAVVFLYTGANLDWPAIAAALGVEATDTLAGNATSDGVLVPVDPNCVPENQRSVGTVPVIGVATTAPAQSDVGGCQQRLVGWDEIGVPQETVDLTYDHTPREFRIVGSDVSELDVPSGVSGNFGMSQEALFTNKDLSSWYRIGSDGVLVETDPPSGDGSPIGGNGQFDFVQGNPDSGIFGGYGNTIGASPTGGPWTYNDWSDLVGDGQVAFVQSIGVTGAGVVEVMQAMPDAIAAQGGVSVSSGGFTVSRATARSPLVITEDATGETVDLTRVWYGPEGVIITDADGNKVGTMDGPTFQSVLSDPSGGSGPNDVLVAVSADGQHVSVESIPQLLGVDVADISSVPRISSAGNTTVIAVTLKDRNADGVPRQLVLVGTPKA